MLNKNNLPGKTKYLYYILKIPNYISNIGVIGTLQFIKTAIEYRSKTFSHFQNKQQNSILNLHSKKYNVDFKIRKNTSDIEVFGNIVLEGSYDFVIKNLPDIMNNAEYTDNLNNKTTEKVCIDLGANTGLFSKIIMSNVAIEKIIAVEPVESNFHMLCENMKGKGNVICLQKGIWNKNTFLKIVSNGFEYGFTVQEVSQSEADVEAVDMKSIIDSFNIEKINLLKVDIEGSEYELFDDNCFQWIHLVNNIIIEIHDHIRFGCHKKIKDVLENNGFYEIKNSFEEQNVFLYTKNLKYIQNAGGAK